MNSKKGASGNPLMDTYHVSVATDTPCYSAELSSNSLAVSIRFPMEPHFRL